MCTHRINTLLLVTLLCVGVSAATASDLEVSNAWVRVIPGGAPAGGYFDLRNNGRTGVQLVGASSPAFGQVMLHQSVIEQGQNRMSHVAKLDVAPASAITFSPGGYHLMMLQPVGKLTMGEKIPVTLQFAGGNHVTAQFDVRGPGGK